MVFSLLWSNRAQGTVPVRLVAPSMRRRSAGLFSNTCCNSRNDRTDVDAKLLATAAQYVRVQHDTSSCVVPLRPASVAWS